VGGYSLADAARILKVSPRQLRHWKRSSLLRPEREEEASPSLGFRDLVSARALALLQRGGVPFARIERSVAVLRRTLPELQQPLESLRIWAEGSRRIVIRHDGVLIEPDGQVVLDFSARDGALPAVSELAPPAPRGQLARAQAHFELGCRLDADPATQQEAIEAYLRAIELEPEHADAHSNLGAIYFTQERWPEAEACFDRALALYPLHVEARLNLGMVCEETGREMAALRHYRRVLALHPAHAPAHANLALVCERLALRRRARRHWKQYLQLEPRGSWAELARRRLIPGSD